MVTLRLRASLLALMFGFQKTCSALLGMNHHWVTFVWEDGTKTNNEFHSCPNSRGISRNMIHMCCGEVSAKWCTLNSQLLFDDPFGLRLKLWRSTSFCRGVVVFLRFWCFSKDSYNVGTVELPLQQTHRNWQFFSFPQTWSKSVGAFAMLHLLV